jgi:hypothetical protein
VHRFTVLFAVILLAGCDGVHIAQGRVLDSKGKPIAGASVQLLKTTETPSPTSPVKTDADGSYNLGMIDDPFGKKKLRLITSKDGFKNYDATFDSSIGKPHTADVTLERNTSD